MLPMLRFDSGRPPGLPHGIFRRVTTLDLPTYSPESTPLILSLLGLLIGENVFHLHGLVSCLLAALVLCKILKGVNVMRTLLAVMHTTFSDHQVQMVETLPKVVTLGVDGLKATPSMAAAGYTLQCPQQIDLDFWGGQREHVSKAQLALIICCQESTVEPSGINSVAPFTCASNEAADRVPPAYADEEEDHAVAKHSGIQFSGAFPPALLKVMALAGFLLVTITCSLEFTDTHEFSVSQCLMCIGLTVVSGLIAFAQKVHNVPAVKPQTTAQKINFWCSPSQKTDVVQQGQDSTQIEVENGGVYAPTEAENGHATPKTAKAQAEDDEDGVILAFLAALEEAPDQIIPAAPAEDYAQARGEESGKLTSVALLQTEVLLLECDKHKFVASLLQWLMCIHMGVVHWMIAFAMKVLHMPESMALPMAWEINSWCGPTQAERARSMDQKAEIKTSLKQTADGSIILPKISPKQKLKTPRPSYYKKRVVNAGNGRPFSLKEEECTAAIAYAADRKREQAAMMAVQIPEGTKTVTEKEGQSEITQEDSQNEDGDEKSFGYSKRLKGTREQANMGVESTALELAEDLLEGFWQQTWVISKSAKEMSVNAEISATITAISCGNNALFADSNVASVTANDDVIIHKFLESIMPFATVQDDTQAHISFTDVDAA